MAKLNETQNMYKVRLNNSIPIMLSQRQLKSVIGALHLADVQIAVRSMNNNTVSEHDVDQLYDEFLKEKFFILKKEMENRGFSLEIEQ